MGTLIRTAPPIENIPPLIDEVQMHFSVPRCLYKRVYRVF